MRCDEVQELASAWLDNELPAPRAEAVAEHEADCEACHAYVSDLRLLSSRMAGLGRTMAPPGLAERVRKSLAEEWDAESRTSNVIPFAARIRWGGFVQQATSLAAVCLLSVFGTWAVVRQPDMVMTTEHDVVAAHVRSLLQGSPIQVPSSDSHTVRPLVGGRLDYVDGHRVATLVYRHGLHTISVFVWPENPSFSPPRLQSQMDGLNVLAWAEDGMVWWAVSDMEVSEMKELRELL
jgi:anti-sigma factor RsiW